MDQIHIRDLAVHCIIGTKPAERVNKQNILINITLDCDLAPAGESDCLEDTVNYKTLKDEIVVMLENSQYYLIERMADRVADHCLACEGVLGVRVTVDKPDALTQAGSVAVEIRRERGR